MVITDRKKPSWSEVIGSGGRWLPTQDYSGPAFTAGCRTWAHPGRAGLFRLVDLAPGASRSMLSTVGWGDRSARAARKTRKRGPEAVKLNSRELSWDGCVNARDLGGMGQIRPGALVRMEQPRRLTEAGWAAAWAYGVRTFVDLRDPDEYEPELAPRPAGITTVRLPLDPVGTPFYEHWTKIDNLASPLYFPAMLAEHPERLVAAVRAIANASP